MCDVLLPVAMGGVWVTPVFHGVRGLRSFSSFSHVLILTTVQQHVAAAAALLYSSIIRRSLSPVVGAACTAHCYVPLVLCVA